MTTVFPYQPASEFETPERCLITELLNADQDAQCSIALARVPVGVTTQLHSLTQTVERYVILEGAGVVEIAGAAPEVVKPLDVVLINAGDSQRVTNTAGTELLILCICTPRFKPDRYQNLEP